MNGHRRPQRPTGEAVTSDAAADGPAEMSWSRIRDLFSLIDVWLVAALCGLSLIAWCAANDKWTRAAWSLPTAYTNDPEKADFFANACYVKAAGNWYCLPFVWKNIPELGAPATGNWNDFPTMDETVQAAQWLLARAFGLFAGLNASFALAHMLSAVAMYASARLCNANRRWAFVAGLAFGLSTFIFAQSPHHMQVAYVWPVALFPAVWRWAATPEGLKPGATTFWIAAGVGAITGLHFIYYLNVFCQIVLLASLIQYTRAGSSSAVRGGLLVIAAGVAGVVFMNLDTLTYRLANGPNAVAFQRDYKWLEIYGLKLVDLFVPPVTHHSAFLASLAREHRLSAPLLDEGASYLGIVGLAAFLWLMSTAVARGIRGRWDAVPLEAWQILWIVLMFTTGGINAIAGTLGFTMFRAACRYSVVILAISLVYAAARLSGIQREAERRDVDGTRQILWNTLVVGIALLVAWDQVPRSPTPETSALIAKLVESDRDFVTRMEAALPPNAMVFQLPIMEFPEAPGPGVAAYDHLRPYLYSKGLKYSFGSARGRPDTDWQRELGTKQLKDAISAIKKRGFSAIYINRNGFPDKGKGIEDALLELGYDKPPIRSAAGDLTCVVLD
jgi:hypothetical protein